MKHILRILLFTLIMNQSFGQSEKADSKRAADLFVENYNADNFEAIFSSFSAEMQSALPFDKTKEFLSGLKLQAGKITKREFINYEQTYASYKTNFERALFILNISIDNNLKINGFFVKPYIENDIPKLERNLTNLQLPFKDEWTVVWGGDIKELNYHIQSEAQKNAFDMVIKDNKGSSFKTDGKVNEDYYAFGKELFAPCDGEVVLAVDGVKDNKPGLVNSFYMLGNSVIIKTGNNEYIIFAHFKQNSITVKQGQVVKQGDLLGFCGNSGNSSEAHLHFHIQNIEELNAATGVKCYFNNVIVNGQSRQDYSPIKNDKIKSE